MALFPSNSDIGPNSLVMLPQAEQDLLDFCTGQVLMAAERARAQYQCIPSLAEMGQLGPILSAEVEDSQALTAANIASQSLATQQVITSFSVPVITDDEISSAPNAVPLGSSTDGAQSVYTPAQIDAAGGSPINWADRMTLKPIKRVKHLLPSVRQMAPAVSTGPAPGPQWGMPAGARVEWCQGLQANPWGKLFLFTGLGLIIVGLLDGKNKRS